jgi:hypothetical protein
MAAPSPPAMRSQAMHGRSRQGVFLALVSGPHGCALNTGGMKRRRRGEGGRVVIMIIITSTQATDHHHYPLPSLSLVYRYIRPNHQPTSGRTIGPPWTTHRPTKIRCISRARPNHQPSVSESSDQHVRVIVPGAGVAKPAAVRGADPAPSVQRYAARSDLVSFAFHLAHSPGHTAKTSPRRVGRGHTR